MTGRAIFVGDRHQAIYGFTGADNDAIDLIIKEFDCTSLPLTTTYRCPKAVVAKAQQIVSHIQAADTAPEGVVRNLNTFNEIFKEALGATDAILCRNTAPLVKLAFQLIRKGVPCHVEGRDIGQGLLKLIRQWKSVQFVPQLVEKLKEWRDSQVNILTAKGKESQAAAISDKIETLLVIAEDCSTLIEIENKINTLFSDSEGNKKPVLTLSTVHKSKGREWNRVFLLGQEKFMPSKYAKAQWELEQENNLIYVAYTRAMAELIMVPAPPPEEKGK